MMYLTIKIKQKNLTIKVGFMDTNKAKKMCIYLHKISVKQTSKYQNVHLFIKNDFF